MTRSQTFAIVIIVALVAVAIPVGIILLRNDDDNGTSDGSPTARTPASGASPTALTAEAVLQQASQRWSQTNSAHFELTVDGKAFVDDAQTIELRSANGDLQRPDSVAATAKISVALIALDISLIAIGNDMYITNFVSGKWEPAPADFGYNPAVLFSDSDGIGAVLLDIQSPQLKGDEEVNGQDARVVSGTVPGDSIRSITAGAISGESIDATVWIDKDDGDILKIVIAAPATQGATASTWTLLVTNHNVPVTITAPQI